MVVQVQMLMETAVAVVAGLIQVPMGMLRRSKGSRLAVVELVALDMVVVVKAATTVAAEAQVRAHTRGPQVPAPTACLAAATAPP